MVLDQGPENVFYKRSNSKCSCLCGPRGLLSHLCHRRSAASSWENLIHKSRWRARCGPGTIVSNPCLTILLLIAVIVLCFTPKMIYAYGGKVKTVQHMCSKKVKGLASSLVSLAPLLEVTP